MDLGVRVGMVLLIVLLVAGICAYHLWLDRRPRTDGAPPAAGDPRNVPRQPR
jgi:uncharacterized iron-regulated membrane protein